MADVKTASERRCGVQFDEPEIPSRVRVSYTRISSKDESRLQFGKKTLTGLFLVMFFVREEDGQVT